MDLFEVKSSLSEIGVYMSELGGWPEAADIIVNETGEPPLQKEYQ